MIKRPNNWNEVKEFSDRPKLPLGAYVCKVRKAVIQNNGYGDQLCILFDIAEGEYNGFFNEDFKNNTNQDKKWKGILRTWLPKDDGSEKDEWTKRTLKGVVNAFEQSNPGYQFDWDESSLAGKMIGVLFRNEEWDYNGKTGWAVRPFRALTVDKVRNNDFTLPADKPLNNSAVAAYTTNPVSVDDFAVISDDDDLPF